MLNPKLELNLRRRFRRCIKQSLPRQLDSFSPVEYDPTLKTTEQYISWHRPPPINLSRRKSLSQPSNTELGKISKKWLRKRSKFVAPQDQATCGSLSVLPTEIRLLIYEFAFDGPPFRICNWDHHFISRPCTTPLPLLWLGHDRFCFGTCVMCTRTRESGMIYKVLMLPSRTAQEALEDRNRSSLVRTCRTIYREALPLLYSGRVMKFEAVHPLLSWASSIVPARLNWVRHLRLSRVLLEGAIHRTAKEGSSPQAQSTWIETWDCIGQMKGLNSIHVVLAHRWGRTLTTSMTPQEELRILGPMHQVICEDFQVAVFWFADDREQFEGWHMQLKTVEFEVLRDFLVLEFENQSDFDRIAQMQSSYHFQNS